MAAADPPPKEARRLVLGPWLVASVGAAVVGVVAAVVLAPYMGPAETPEKPPSPPVAAAAPSPEAAARPPVRSDEIVIEGVQVGTTSPLPSASVAPAASAEAPAVAGTVVAPPATAPPAASEPPTKKTTAEVPRRLAELTAKRNDVKARRAGQLQWASARRGMNLFENDAVKTGAASNAVVTFDRDRRNVLDVQEKTLVVIKAIMKKDPARRAVRNELVLIEGNLNGRWQRTPRGEDVILEMKMPSAALRIDTSESRGGKAEARVIVDKDANLSGIAVYQGRVEVRSPDTGEKVVVRGGEFTEVAPNKGPMRPVPLPATPRLMSPAQGSRLKLSDGPVALQWSQVRRAAAYDVEVAADALFSRSVVAFDDPEATAEWTPTGRGRFFWRVTARDEAGRGGRASETGWFEVVQDQADARLEITAPRRGMVTREGQVEIAGVTTAGSRLEVNNRQVEVGADGRFSQKLDLVTGANILVFTVIDPTGNIANQRRMVTYKPRAEAGQSP